MVLMKEFSLGTRSLWPITTSQGKAGLGTPPSMPRVMVSAHTPTTLPDSNICLEEVPGP